MNWERFVQECPTCHSKKKKVKHCTHCNVLTCRVCSVGDLCIDCFLKAQPVKEVNTYNEEKYGAKL